MDRKEKRVIKEMFEVCIRSKITDKVFEILKKANSSDFNDLFYEAYLAVVKDEAREKEKKLKILESDVSKKK